MFALCKRRLGAAFALCKKDLSVNTTQLEWVGFCLNQRHLWSQQTVLATCSQCGRQLSQYALPYTHTQLTTPTKKKRLSPMPGVVVVCLSLLYFLFQLFTPQQCWPSNIPIKTLFFHTHNMYAFTYKTTRRHIVLTVPTIWYYRGCSTVLPFYHSDQHSFFPHTTNISHVCIYM